MDDLLDLDWDKKPAAPPLRQQGAAAPAYRAPGQSSTYSFDALTRSMPSTAAQTQKKPSPSPSPTPPMGYSLSSQSQAPKAQAQAQAQASAAKTGDAFSSLFAGAAGGGEAGTGAGASSSSSSSSQKTSLNLSMAQRLQGNNSTSSTLLNPTRANQSQKANGDAWSGLESLGFSQPASKGPSPSVSQNQSNDDFFNFDDFTSQKAAPRAPTAAATRSKAGPAAPPAAAPQPKSKDPFDFSDFEDPGDSQSSALGGGGGGGGGGGDGGRRKEPERPSEGPIKAAQTDLSRGPGLLGDEDYDDGIDDGILGALGGPPGRAKPAAMVTKTATGASQPRPASPPPHIIGQVVEMGFSPFEAREALARTGNDVSAALEQLLASSSSSKAPALERPSHSRQEQEDRRYAERLQRREQAAQRPPASSSNGRNGGPERRRRDDDGDAGEDGQVDWQKQADQIYAQASELGASVFSKANAFWTTAKAQAQRALEERNNLNLDGQGSSAASSGRNSPASGSERAKSRRWAVPSRDGRSTPRKEWEGKPRWMVEAEAAAAAEEEEEEQSRPKKQPSGEMAPTSSFRDDDDGDEVAPAPPFLPARPEGSRPREEAPRNLWDMESEAPPRPSSTTARPQASKPRPGAAAAAVSGSSARRTPAAKAAAAAAARTARPIEEDGAAAVELSKRHKARGNEHFKKGAYGEAEAAYSAGLDALDAHPKSLRRVPLLNNRANARLKNGDARAVLADTKDVLVLIVAGGKSPFTLYRPSEEAPLPGALAQEVNLRDGYAKALLRRAQAEEMLEQWDTARSVWTLLERYEKEEGSSGTTGVTNLRAAQEGAKRCQKMFQPAAAAEGGAQAAGVQHKDVVRQKVDRATARAVAKAEESARARIRAENAATAAEEAAKHALRDGVDARILAWKGGKEANVRALLASLQDVVWDGLGWKKVGMHELVTDAQVKRNYMKAIGKLHPDKLTPRNNSLEERLLGGAVFSVLNDAWSAQP